MDQITENIWLGNSRDARKLEELERAGITAILNVAIDLPNRVQHPEIVSSHTGLVDGPGNGPARYLSAILQLAALTQAGYTVLVHCHEGISRSPFVVACLLVVARAQPDLYAALNYIAQRRPQIDPAPGHFKVVTNERLTEWKLLLSHL